MPATRSLLVPMLLAFAAAVGVLNAFPRPEPDASSQPRPAGQPRAGAADTLWGEPVDGLAARLTVQPHYTAGQALSAVIEVKNVSARKRYVIPSLNPMFPSHLAIEITAPDGRKARRPVRGNALYGPGNYAALTPGEVRRFEVFDLRDYFDLENFQPYPTGLATRLKPGKYTLTCRFQSPKVPRRFAFPSTDGKGGKVYVDPSPELVAGHWTGPVSARPTAFVLAPLSKDDLVIHEWGVFTVFNDAKYANLNRKEEWGSLPSFFYRQFPKGRLRWVPAAWDKPIVYFYAKPPSLRLTVKVTFAAGAPVVWWPAVAHPVDRGPPQTAGTAKRARPFRSLTWDAWLGERVPDLRHDQWVKVKDFPLPAACWLREARLPGTSQVTVVGNAEDWPKQRVFPGSKDRHETERFLYYDGLVPAPAYLRCEKVEAKTVVLRNRAPFDLTRLFVVDRRIKGTVGFTVVGRDRPFKARTAQRVELQAIAAADWPAVGIQQVRQQLLDAGLFAAEADALLKIWRQRLLEADGITVFHILPAAEYDRMLPLDIQPAPAARPVRVGIALHPHVEVEPDLASRVTALIGQLSDAKFDKRAAASKALLEIGPLAIAMLRAALYKGPPLETRRRLEAVLNRVDVSDWLNVVPAAKAGKP